MNYQYEVVKIGRYDIETELKGGRRDEDGSKEVKEGGGGGEEGGI